MAVVTTFEAEWRARFERFARRHQDEATISGWSPAGLERRVRLFRSLMIAIGLPTRSRVLDLGCGAGTYVRLLADAGHRAVGLDYSLPTLHRARAADPKGQGRYVAGEAYDLPFAGSSFDLVLSIGVVQALAQPERALDQMIRVLRPGGVLVVEALNGQAAAALVRRVAERIRQLPPRVRRYSPGRIRRWLGDRGLSVIGQPGIYLPPRRLPLLAGLLDLRPVVRALASCPGLAEATAHSFLFVARRALEGRHDGAPRSRSLAAHHQRL